ncbi:MAG: signal recognition particle protein Srp19 [Candidatus Helarchaeota archaeon]|nr:signal recognition particle protein Srp19 [Candidatus Helarchaeota archaeon]
MKKRNKLYFYPAYFDTEKTRGEGRRVSKKLAVKSPSLEMMAKSASALGCKFEIEIGKAYPRSWWSPGRLAILNPSEKKGKILIKLTKKMKKLKK